MKEKQETNVDLNKTYKAFETARDKIIHAGSEVHGINYNIVFEAFNIYQKIENSCVQAVSPIVCSNYINIVAFIAAYYNDIFYEKMAEKTSTDAGYDLAFKDKGLSFGCITILLLAYLSVDNSTKARGKRSEKIKTQELVAKQIFEQLDCEMVNKALTKYVNESQAYLLEAPLYIPQTSPNVDITKLLTSAFGIHQHPLSYSYGLNYIRRFGLTEATVKLHLYFLMKRIPLITATDKQEIVLICSDLKNISTYLAKNYQEGFESYYRKIYCSLVSNMFKFACATTQSIGINFKEVDQNVVGFINKLNHCTKEELAANSLVLNECLLIIHEFYAQISFSLFSLLESATKRSLQNKLGIIKSVMASYRNYLELYENIKDSRYTELMTNEQRLAYYDLHQPIVTNMENIANFFKNALQEKWIVIYDEKAYQSLIKQVEEEQKAKEYAEKDKFVRIQTNFFEQQEPEEIEIQETRPEVKIEGIDLLFKQAGQYFYYKKYTEAKECYLQILEQDPISPLQKITAHDSIILIEANFLHFNIKEVLKALNKRLEQSMPINKKNLQLLGSKIQKINEAQKTMMDHIHKVEVFQKIKDADFSQNLQFYKETLTKILKSVKELQKTHELLMKKTKENFEKICLDTGRKLAMVQGLENSSDEDLIAAGKQHFIMIAKTSNRGPSPYKIEKQFLKSIPKPLEEITNNFIKEKESLESRHPKVSQPNKITILKRPALQGSHVPLPVIVKSLDSAKPNLFNQRRKKSLSTTDLPANSPIKQRRTRATSVDSPFTLFVPRIEAESVDDPSLLSKTSSSVET